MIAEGLVVQPSSYEPHETADRLAAAVAEKGMTLFARVDHAAGAAEVGMTLRPIEVLIFGNPRTGTPLMLAAATIGIDLPLKALVWQDEAGTTWIAYDDPKWIARRHGLGAEMDSVVEAMAAALATVVEHAVAPPA